MQTSQYPEEASVHGPTLRLSAGQASHYQNNITSLGRAVTVNMPPAWTHDTNLSESYCSGTQSMEKRFIRYSLQIFVKLLLGPMTTKVSILKI